MIAVASLYFFFFFMYLSQSVSIYLQMEMAQGDDLLLYVFALKWITAGQMHDRIFTL